MGDRLREEKLVSSVQRKGQMRLEVLMAVLNILKIMSLLRHLSSAYKTSGGTYTSC